MGRPTYFSFAIMLGVVGLISALISLCLASLPPPFAYFFIGAPLGLALSICFRLCGFKGPIWKMLALTVVSAIAFPISALAAFYLEFFSPWPFHAQRTGFNDYSNGMLFAGGTLGAFLLSAVVFLITDAEQSAPKVVFRAFCLSLAGGILSVIGGRLGSLVWWFQGEPSRGSSEAAIGPAVDSLFFV
jgi:hypothetical protein